MAENGLSSIPDPAVADADGSSWEYGGRRLRVRVADERDVAALARLHGHEGESNALMREADTRISGLSIEDVFDQGLHEFLVEFMTCNVAIGDAIATDYRFLA